MEEKNKRKTIILLIIGTIALIGVVVGATFAYFAAQVGKGESTTLNVKAGTTDDLSFSLKDLDTNKEKVVDNDSSIPIVINANQTNFAEGNANIADGVTGTATLIAGDDDYIAEESYNVYLNITKNELKYSSYIKKEPDETPENILSFKDETKKGEADLSEYNPRPELYLTIKENGTEIKTGVTVNDKELNYSENVFAKDGTQLGGFDITETKGLIKISVPTEIKVEKENDNHTTTDTWEITVTFMNLDTDQNLNTGKSVIGEVLIQKEEKVLTLAELCTGEKVSECFTKNYKEDKTIIYHNAIAASEDKIENPDKIAGDDSYRYSGADADVKNYVCLDSRTTGDCESDEDLYRIIGLFKNEEGKYEIKLIKASLGTTKELGDENAKISDDNPVPSAYDDSDSDKYYWNSSNGITEENNNTNMWRYSNLNKVNLNSYYYNYITTRASYLQNHITEHTWITTGYQYYNVDTKAMYEYELGINKVKENENKCYTQSDPKTPIKCTEKDLEYTDHIGLMYVTDYLYSFNPKYWNILVSNLNSETDDKIEISWIPLGGWVITALDDGESARRLVGSLGYPKRNDYWYVYTSSFVFPTFYLTSDARISEGEGSKELPYRVTFE